MQGEKLTFGNFSSRLTELVNHTGMAARDVAIAAKISPAALSRYMNGQRFPKLAEAQRLAAALGMSVDLLLQADAALLSEKDKPKMREQDGEYAMDWQSSAQDAEERLHRVRGELLRIRSAIDTLLESEFQI